MRLPHEACSCLVKHLCLVIDEWSTANMKRSLAIVGFLLATAVCLVAQQITYIYDEAGRLVGEVELFGNAAADKYDATGNLQSNVRYTSSQGRNYSPQMRAGRSASGFSATPSPNTVKFNGQIQWRKRNRISFNQDSSSAS